MLSTKFLLIAAAVVLAIGLAWRLHSAVFESGRKACELEHSKAAEQADAADRKDAQGQSRRDGAAAKAQAHARVAQLTRRHELEADIARRPADAACGLDSTALELLNRAITSGNQESAPSPCSVSGSVSSGTGGDGWESCGSQAVGE